MKKKIYIVTSGEYSDYGIEAVFTTKEKANDYVEQHGTYYNIEEYDLDEEVEKKTQLWYIEFGVEGGKLSEAHPTICNRNEKVDTCSIFDSFGYRKKESYIFFYIDADSMDRAVKIARERFAAVKANEYIWLRLTRPYELDMYGKNKYESFNIKTNEFIK
jgi:hypothetical protein